MESRKINGNKSSPVPLPRTMGVFMAIVAVMSLGAGIVRSELALVLVGAIIIIISAYFFIAVFILSLVHRKGIPGLSAQFVPSSIPEGSLAGLSFSGPAFPGKGLTALPGILIRYEINIKTHDRREQHYVFHLHEKDTLHTFTETHRRGAYFGKKDMVSIFDVLGFFRLSIYATQKEDLRLAVTPPISAEVPGIPARSGGTEHREEPHFIRTDDLIDHRQYVPGDDPRRINWKLYGHVRELFVREGEPEPPPKSKLIILIDTSVDESLYNHEDGCSGVDALCGCALAIALEYTNRGVEVMLGYNGSALKGGKGSALAGILAFPYAFRLRDRLPLPAPAENSPVLLLALPRESTEESALDMFLKKRSPGRSVDVFFIFRDEIEGKAAELCSRIYGQRGGVYARYFRAV